MKIPILLIALSTILVTVTSCNKNKLTPECIDGEDVNYDDDVRIIIEANCAISGCHDAGSNDGAWTSYAKLKPILDDGKFEKRVIVKQNMPRGKRVITQEEINTLQCWLENDFAEN